MRAVRRRANDVAQQAESPLLLPAPLPKGEMRIPNRVVIGGAMVAALGGLLFGFDTAVISGTNEALQKVFDLDSFWLGFTVAVAMIGTIVGSFAVSKPSDLFGRKNVLFALGTFVHWSMAATVTWSFPVVAKHHVAAAFGFFGSMMLLQFLFVWKLMPETKGVALEDIEKRLTAARG